MNIMNAAPLEKRLPRSKEGQKEAVKATKEGQKEAVKATDKTSSHPIGSKEVT